MSWHAGKTEWSRFVILASVEYIGGWRTQGLVVTVLWWFVVVEATVNG